VEELRAKYVQSEDDVNKIENIFTFHPVFGDQRERYEYLRHRAKELALSILTFTPKSREQSLAITALQDAVMWANAAIAINESNKSEEN